MKISLEALLNSALTQGYLLIPRELIKSILQKDEFARVLLTILSEVNFADRENVSGDKRYLCRKGESIRSLRSWSQVLGVHIPQVKYYFRELKSLGYLDHIDNPLHGGHIRVVDYDRLTGRDYSSILSPSSVGQDDDALFTAFWVRYHRETGLVPQERDLAWVYWMRLTVEERDMAYDRITDYYNGLAKKEYCRKATKYLKYKSFIS